MRIKVIEGEKCPVNLYFPTWLGVNYVTAFFAPLFINFKAKGFKVRVGTCFKFVRCFYKTRKHFGGEFDLVDIKTHDGTSVKITV